MAHGGSWAQMFASPRPQAVRGAALLRASDGDTRKKKAAARSYNFVPPSEVGLLVASSQARLQERLGRDGGDGKEGGGRAVNGAAAGEEGMGGKEIGGGGEKEKEQTASGE